MSGGVIKNAGTVNINDSEFTNDSADYGGVIYNSNELNIDSSTFNNNHASSSGGAIHNSTNGTVNITGNTTFESNTHSPNAGDDIPNDVFNTGTINLNPDKKEKIFFGGGIDGDGGSEHGTLNINGQGEVWVRNELIYHDVNLNSGSLVLAPSTSAKASRFVIEENAKFSANNTVFKNSHAGEEEDGGAISITFANEDNAGEELISITSSEFKNNTAESGGAFSNLQGMSSGDAWKNTTVWMQGLANHAKLDTTSKSNGFKADTYGAAFGVEKKIDNDVKAGIGYAYNKTDVNSKGRDTDVKTHTLLAYGKYNPFVNSSEYSQ